MVLIKFISYQLSKATIIQYTYTNDFRNQQGLVFAPWPF